MPSVAIIHLRDGEDPPGHSTVVLVTEKVGGTGSIRSGNRRVQIELSPETFEQELALICGRLPALGFREVYVRRVDRQP